MAPQMVFAYNHPSRKAAIYIDKVNELTAAGTSLEEAIAQTWTATRARAFGFTKVTLLGTPSGAPGEYTKIDVLIEK